MSQGTALAPHVPTDDEIQKIRQRGGALVAYTREVNELEKTIQGLSWGTVTAKSLSPHTRYALAEFCRITRANPLTHIDVLGGRPYLNANYWSDLVTQHPLFHHYEQRDLSPSVAKSLRDRAKRHHEVADALKEADPSESARRRAMAGDLEDQADDVDFARSGWSPPANMAVVIETTIYRFMNQAPMDEIRAGRVNEFEKYLIQVSECNWAGGKEKDPVGNANPGLTARTRSFRRAAVKAFSAWTSQYDAQISKAEDAIEAEFTIIEGDAPQRITGPQAVATGSGEPQAAPAQGARPLPVHGAMSVEQEVRAQEFRAELEAKPPEGSLTPPEFDRRDAQKRVMATFNDAGIKGDARKVWARENGYPESTSEWTPAQFDEVVARLTDPVKEFVQEVADSLGVELEDVALEVIGQARPQYLKHWNQIRAELEKRAAGGGEV